MSRALRSMLAAIGGLLAGKARNSPQPDDVLPGEAKITLVALIVQEWDRQLLSRLAAEHRWTVHFVRTSSETRRVLNESKAPILLCARDVPGADWRGVMREMATAPHPVCAILISNVADDYLWNEVIRRGGHDVLATPFREENVLRAIRLAWLYWNSAMKSPAGAA